MTTITSPLRAGDSVHILDGSFSLLTRVGSLSLADSHLLTRGASVVLTDEIIEANRDRLGVFWMDGLIDDPDAQRARFGFLAIGRGSFPEEARLTEHGSAEWQAERERALTAADAVLDPDERTRARAAVRERFDSDNRWRKNSTRYRDEGEQHG